MNSMAHMRDDVSEDASRSGYRVVDMDVVSIEGDLPITASALVDVNRVSESPVVTTLQELARLWDSDKIINVVPRIDLAVGL